MDFEPQMLNLRGLESANVAKAKIAKIDALKISNPSRVFAVVAKAGSIGATEKAQKCGLLNVEP